MGDTNSPSIAHVGYDISPLSRVKVKILTTHLTSMSLTNMAYTISGESVCLFQGQLQLVY
jgi:hypothetical protein